MSQVRYTETHEWLRWEEDGTVTVGITPHAVEMLGELVYIGLPEIGAEVVQGAEAAVVESVKAASEVPMPIDGSIVEVNTTLVDDPKKVTAEPEGGGWLFRMKPSRTEQHLKLLDKSAYEALIGLEK